MADPIKVNDITSGVTYIPTVLNSNIAFYGTSSFTTTALAKNGGSSMFCIAIDGSKIGGTINSVKISYKAYGSRTGILGSKASIRTGYVNSSNNQYVEVNSHGDVGRGSSNAKSYTDTIDKPYNEQGYLILFFKCINNIASQTNTVYVSNISIEIYYTPITYTIFTQVSPTEGGVVTGGGTYSSGAIIELKAIANDGYKFVKWNDGNTENPRLLYLEGDVNLTAIFELDKINKILIDTEKPKKILIDNQEVKAIFVDKTKVYG